MALWGMRPSTMDTPFRHGTGRLNAILLSVRVAAWAQGGDGRRAEIAGTHTCRRHIGLQGIPPVACLLLVIVLEAGPEEQFFALIEPAELRDQHRAADVAAGIVIVRRHNWLAERIIFPTVRIHRRVPGVQISFTVKIDGAVLADSVDDYWAFWAIRPEVRGLNRNLVDHVGVQGLRVRAHYSRIDDTSSIDHFRGSALRLRAVDRVIPHTRIADAGLGSGVIGCISNSGENSRSGEDLQQLGGVAPHRR